MKKIIDLRSDTITKPSKEMRKAMCDAEVGDDVFKEDPTVNELQNYAAELLGKEAALFVSSGVMGNQLCLHVLTRPGDEVICEKDAHIFQYESASPAFLSGIQMNTINGAKGKFSAAQAEELIRPVSAYYMPRSRVIEIENTHNRAGGTIWPLNDIKEIRALAEKKNLFTHLDGARIWNASVASGIKLSEYAKYFDTVSCCLSKGLGAPVGSLIAGPKELIQEAFRIRKAWGGGMRQVGIVAAAGLYALKNNIERLKEDHEKAALFAKAVKDNPNFQIDFESVETNIVVFKPLKTTAEEAQRVLRENGALLSIGAPGHLRAVAHLDVAFEEVQEAADILNSVFD